MDEARKTGQNHTLSPSSQEPGFDHEEHSTLITHSIQLDFRKTMPTAVLCHGATVDVLLSRLTREPVAYSKTCAIYITNSPTQE